MTAIMMRPGAMYCMYGTPSMSPTRWPIKLPKITKYSAEVTAEGTMVCAQMRMMRPYSRMMMVLKPIQRARAERLGRIRRRASSRAAVSLTARALRPAGPFRSTSFMNSSSSRLTLLRMDSTPMPCAVRLREHLVEALLLRHLDLERVVVDEVELVARHQRHGSRWPRAG